MTSATTIETVATMSISDDDLARLELLVGEAPDGRWNAEFRRNFPGLSLTVCDGSDVDGESPFRRWARFDVFLVDRSEHCWRLTAEPARATGVVLARRKAQP